MLRAYLTSREEEALELVQRRTAQGRVAAGMPSAWAAARTQQPEMLDVERGLFSPAEVAVDELIEHVMIRGGWVAFVDDRALARSTEAP